MQDSVKDHINGKWFVVFFIYNNEYN